MALIILVAIILIIIGIALFFGMMSVTPYLSHLFDKKDVRTKQRIMGHEVDLHSYELKKEIETSIKMVDTLIESIDDEEELAELRQLRETYETLMREIRNTETIKDFKEKGD